MFIYYQTKYECTCIYIAGNLFIAAIMRHYPRPEYQFQKKTHVLWNRDFKGQARLRWQINNTIYIYIYGKMHPDDTHASMINVMRWNY